MVLLDIETLGALDHRSKLIMIAAIIGIAVAGHIIYMLFFHPLAKFPGPWYLKLSSIFIAIMSAKHQEPQFFMYLVRKYGSKQFPRHILAVNDEVKFSDHRPIRVAPNVLFFPQPSVLKELYWDPHCNQKALSYGSGLLGPPQMFTTLDSESHRVLRKTLSNAPWTIGPFMKEWEPRFDELIEFFLLKMREHASAGRTICLSDAVAFFAADVMSMICFTEPFGCVAKQRDERGILENWRQGLTMLGFASRFYFFREVILKTPKINLWFLPATSDKHGMGWLMREAQRQLTSREESCDKGEIRERPDFLQHCLDARYPDGSALTPAQKAAHVTLLIQAGADTTATAMGSTLRFLAMNQPCLERAHEEIQAADKAGLLSNPIQYNEARRHLPYFCACIKEGVRLNPPATNIFARVVPEGGKVMDGHFIPGGTEISSYAYSIQRDKELYGEDAEEFNPERWIASEKRNFELEASQFTFGYGFRVCIGEDIAILEMHKLLTEVVRNFDIELVEPGKYVVDGGLAYNRRLMVKLIERQIK